MIYVFESSNNNASIVYDETTLTEEEKLRGIPVEELPPKEEIEGKEAVLKCNKETGEVWWEYKDKKYPEEQITKEVETLKQSLAELSVIVSMLTTPTE